MTLTRMLCLVVIVLCLIALAAAGARWWILGLLGAFAAVGTLLWACSLGLADES